MKAITSIAIVSLLAGCATPLGNVMPKPNNRYDVISTGQSEQDAMESALATAEATCKNRNLRHVVVGHQTKYKGTLSEDTNKFINASASIMRSMTAKHVPTFSSTEDYQVTMEFSCEA